MKSNCFKHICALFRLDLTPAKLLHSLLDSYTMLHISKHLALPIVNAKVEGEAEKKKKKKKSCALHVAILKLLVKIHA